MQHPINPLNDAGLDMLCDRLTDIAVALDDNNIHNMERIERILPLELFNELRAYLGTIREAQRTICELLYGDRALLVSDGLVGAIENHMKPADPASLDERIASIHDTLIGEHDGSHPCLAPDCEHTVLYDDEPYCFTHSPDEGSSVVGYSYRQQQAEAVDCAPHGIARPAWLAHNMAAERRAAQLARGVITRDEFEAAMAALNTEYSHRQGGALALTPEGTPG